MAFTGAGVDTLERPRVILDELPPNVFTDDEEREWQAITSSLVLDIPFCPWKPNLGPQSVFLLDFGRESLYGGAAGGGKSIALMMAASQFLDVPGYAALLVRKSFSDLGKPGALMDIADKWWGPLRGHGVKFDTQQHTYIFDCPGGGTSKIVFGALDNENDRFKYQGGAYHFVGFDELTQQKERDYKYLFSRVRRTADGELADIPIRIRSTTNPGGVGHEWVYKRFIARWEKWREGKAKRPRRNFYPALLDDNPKLDREDYAASMMELDPVTRAQLLRGDWNIRPDGRLFRSRWFKPVNRADLPGDCRWVRAWDMAGTDPSAGRDPDYTVGALLGRSPDGRIFIADVRRWRKDPGDNDKLCTRVGMLDTRRVKQVMEQEPGSAGKTAIWHYRTLVFTHSDFTGIPASGKSMNRSTVLVGRKTPPAKILAAGPFASAASAGLVHVVIDGSWDWEAFIDEMEIFPDGEHDDQVDGVSLAYNWLMKYGVNAPNFGDSNGEMEKANEWRPEAIGQFFADVTDQTRATARASVPEPPITHVTAAEVDAQITRETANAFYV